MKLAQRYNAQYNKQISLTFSFLATKSLRGTCLPERGCAIFSICTRLKSGVDSISAGGLSLKHTSAAMPCCALVLRMHKHLDTYPLPFTSLSLRYSLTMTKLGFLRIVSHRQTSFARTQSLLINNIVEEFEKF